MVMFEGVVHVVHLVSTLFMTGVIWFVQVVHYPLKARVGANAFPAYQTEHLRRTTWVVGPPMVLEALSAAALVTVVGGPDGRGLALVGLLLLVVIWLSTATAQVPSHHVLERDGFSEEPHRRLVRSNWVRTVAWSLRAGLACWMLLAWSSA